MGAIIKQRCHSRESGNLGFPSLEILASSIWIPAFAGMTWGGANHA